MKLNLIVAALILFALPAGLGAQTSNIRIPFAFIASDHDFAAGAYQLSVLTHHLKLTRESGPDATAAFLPCRWNGLTKPDGKMTMVFEKLGDAYVLREYRLGTAGSSRAVPLSKKRAAWAKGYYAKMRQPDYVLISTEM